MIFIIFVLIIGAIAIYVIDWKTKQLTVFEPQTNEKIRESLEDALNQINVEEKLEQLVNPMDLIQHKKTEELTKNEIDFEKEFGVSFKSMKNKKRGYNKIINRSDLLDLED